jgi:hypothetical protein
MILGRLAHAAIAQSPAIPASPTTVAATPALIHWSVVAIWSAVMLLPTVIGVVHSAGLSVLDLRRRTGRDRLQ